MGLGAGACVLLGCAVVTEVEVGLCANPTQYASSAQKPLEQSDETAGFQARN